MRSPFPSAKSWTSPPTCHDTDSGTVRFTVQADFRKKTEIFGLDSQTRRKLRASWQTVRSMRILNIEVELGRHQIPVERPQLGVTIRSFTKGATWKLFKKLGPTTIR
jgi:hypothetical protein